MNVIPSDREIKIAIQSNSFIGFKGLVRCTEEVVGILLIIFSCSTALQDNERFSHQGVVLVDYFPQGFSDIVCLIVLFPVD